MKETKRALRRHQKETKFNKRIKNWVKDSWDIDKTLQETVEAIKKGQRSTWLRTTGSPCNCWMCSGEYKYVREQKQYVFKDFINGDKP